MKFFASFFILLLCVVYSHQLWKFENCTPDHPIVKGHEKELSCGVMKCMEDGSAQGTGCGFYQSRNAKGYKAEDPTKPYPDCCGGPIYD